MLDVRRHPQSAMGVASADFLVRDQELRVVPLIYLHHFFRGEVAAGGEVGDRFEVEILSTRQAPPLSCRRCS